MWLNQYLRDFKESLATKQFIVHKNNIFVILNSRTMVADGFKCGVQATNKNKIFQQINDWIKYLLSLQCTPTGEPLHMSQRKIGFIGLVISWKSFIALYKSHIDERWKKCLLGYKLCQDHLEIFFSAIRSRGEYNNNPTPKQFKSSYKRLLIHVSMTDSNSANSTELIPSIILA